MSSDEIAISVQNLSKCYQLYAQPQDRLKQSILPRFQRWLGRIPSNYYSEFWALKDVSFEVRRGETIGIIGRNGSGKSTLLQIICGTLAPTSGTVETKGRIAALLELGSGFNPEFTGRENVYMNGAILGLSQEEIGSRFDEITAFADIGQFIEQPVKTYSSGMMVRLAFAVIAHINADILVIDEALSVGDVFFTQKCMRFLRKFMKKGTVLFVSHDSSAVMNLCQVAVWLQDGKNHMVADSKTVCESYLEEAYSEHQEVYPQKVDETPLTESPDLSQKHALQEGIDGRQAFLNLTQHRNDLEIFNFDPHTDKFGEGGVEVKDVSLRNDCGEALSWVVGSEVVQLCVEAIALKSLNSIIVGFYVKDRLGQMLFGDNTYLSYLDKPISVLSGQVFSSSFTFRMPILPVGDYSITIAIATGANSDHIQQAWLHDALVFKSHSSSVTTGLIGIPMIDIDFQNRG
jgi:homopolymeric O-antigen transport system ATP-binding protein